MKAAKKICGISRGGHKPQVAWWWNDEVKKAIKEKTLLYMKWQKDRCQKSRTKSKNGK